MIVCHKDSMLWNWPSKLKSENEGVHKMNTYSWIHMASNCLLLLHYYCYFIVTFTYSPHCVHSTLESSRLHYCPSFLCVFFLFCPVKGMNNTWQKQNLRFQKRRYKKETKIWECRQAFNKSRITTQLNPNQFHCNQMTSSIWFQDIHRQLRTYLPLYTVLYLNWEQEQEQEV